ncbi:MAG TPA: DUF4267 domain-containing protein, partial [Stackebrandtia sp.]|uniref:DUF4267 domain-containing protein n=1 Tax=Stackebrandtia sp. TaxID=2023065 RepID=UPI002D2E7B77
MTLKRVANVLTLLLAAFLLYMAIDFLFDPHGAAAGFGLPASSVPGADGTAFLKVKGGRDLGLGLLTLALLYARQPKALGWALLAMTASPICDASVVVSYGGGLATALSIHITAATFVAVTGLLQLR